jgi:hypothetical protein
VLRIRKEPSAISIESNEGHNCQWTYKGLAEAEVLKLRQYDQNSGYQGIAN